MSRSHDRCFLAGYIAGEGCFGVQLRYSEERIRHNVGLTPYFSVNLHDDDREVLEQFQETYGIGRIEPNHTPNQTQWKVTSREDLVELSDQIMMVNTETDFLSSTDKFSTFLEWNELRKEIYYYNDKHQSRKSKDQLKELIKRAKSLNTKGYNGKSTKEWIQRIE
ncbi:LAGLIDADG endonuclease [Haloarcula virus HVTV-2]|uniref:HNH domain endonuclease n=1 Tax=Haloarcula vallismortis tailed virus 1 TaxID=1262528 RepID=L7TI17_9CAUD|nr:HNH endonuclease [Haloarcula vallismortis tailed virus 1]AGC34486.1 HNH domain endonuclease [Haloarcula vallismortis tailed virus 1]UBF22924.1 LAGLIDADG endonuclease [Haloarcula virus HVTV-2]